MTILAFWNAIVMYMNFNKGLKEASKAKGKIILDFSLLFNGHILIAMTY